MADNDILINIETAYKSGDMEAFKRSLEDAKRKADGLSEATQNLQNKSAGAGRELNNAQRALGGLNGAASVSRGSFQGLSQTLEAFGGKLATVAAKFSILAGSFSAGYAIGTTLDKWLGISQKIADLYAGPMSKVGSIQSRISADLKALDGITLANLKTQFEGITKTLSDSNEAIGTFYASMRELAAAQTDLKISAIERSMPPGPQRDAAIANEQRRSGLREVAFKRSEEQQKAEAAQEAISAADDAMAEQVKAQIRAQSAMRDARTPEESAAARAQYNAATSGRTSAQANAAASRAKQQPVIDAAQQRLQVLAPGGIAEQTVANKYFSQVPDDQTRAGVAGRLQSMLSTEEGFASRSDTPIDLQIQGGENAAALRQLLREVQSGNDAITKDLLQLFQSQADNQANLRKALDVAKSSMSNLPL